MESILCAALLFVVAEQFAHASPSQTQVPMSNGSGLSTEEASMILTERDSGRTLVVALGDTITVRLGENPTTGYQWTVETAEGLQGTGDRFEPGAAIGASGNRELKFLAKRAGACRLRLKHWREWEGESSVTHRFQVDFSVR